MNTLLPRYLNEIEAHLSSFQFLCNHHNKQKAMGVATLVGVVLLGFGPSAALFVTVVARRSQLVLLSVTAAFACLVALVVAGAFWAAYEGSSSLSLQSVAAVTVVQAVLLQELGRYLFLEAYRVGDEKILELVGDGVHKSPFLDFSSAIAVGVGFGLMSTLLMYGGVLEASLAPGDYFTESCPKVSGFVISAMLALLFQVMHLALTIIALDAVRRRKKAPMDALVRLLLVVGIHMAASLLSLINSDVDYGCKVGLPLQAIVVLCSVGAAVIIVRSSNYGKNPV